MPLLTALAGILLQLAGSLVGRVLIALGMSYVTYKGFDTGITWLLDQIKSNMSAMPVDVLSFLAWCWVDKAISLIFSAYSAALAVKTAGAASFKKIVTK